MNHSAKRRQSTLRPPEPAPAPVEDHAAPLLIASGVATFVAGPADAGGRLDRFIAEAAEAAGLALSRTRVQALVAEGRVGVDGVATTDPRQKVREGASVTIDVPPPVEAEPKPEPMALSIVYEDAHLVVVDKPAGLVVHPAAGHATGTLVNGLLAHCAGSLSGIGGVARPGIVHRLDKDTSGLIVAAKDDPTHRGLAALFADHGRTGSLRREYLALAWAAFERPAGRIDLSIGRDPIHRDRMAVSRRDGARHAVTHYVVEEAFGPASLVRCRLETGRTHQIRVHLAQLGHPLLGDAVYGGGFRTKATQLGESAREALAGLGRQALHAATLGFEHPITGEELSFDSPLPADLAHLLSALRDGG